MGTTRSQRYVLNGVVSNRFVYDTIVYEENKNLQDCDPPICNKITRPYYCLTDNGTIYFTSPSGVIFCVKQSSKKAVVVYPQKELVTKEENIPLLHTVDVDAKVTVSGNKITVTWNNGSTSEGQTLIKGGHSQLYPWKPGVVGCNYSTGDATTSRLIPHYDFDGNPKDPNDSEHIELPFGNGYYVVQNAEYNCLVFYDGVLLYDGLYSGKGTPAYFAYGVEYCPNTSGLSECCVKESVAWESQPAWSVSSNLQTSQSSWAKWKTQKGSDGKLQFVSRSWWDQALDDMFDASGHKQGNVVKTANLTGGTTSPYTVLPYIVWDDKHPEDDYMDRESFCLVTAGATTEVEGSLDESKASREEIKEYVGQWLTGYALAEFEKTDEGVVVVKSTKLPCDLSSFISRYIDSPALVKEYCKEIDAWSVLDSKYIPFHNKLVELSKKAKTDFSALSSGTFGKIISNLTDETATESKAYLTEAKTNLDALIEYLPTYDENDQLVTSNTTEEDDEDESDQWVESYEGFKAAINAWLALEKDTKSGVGVVRAVTQAAEIVYQYCDSITEVSNALNGYLDEAGEKIAQLPSLDSNIAVYEHAQEQQISLQENEEIGYVQVNAAGQIIQCISLPEEDNPKNDILYSLVTNPPLRVLWKESVDEAWAEADVLEDSQGTLVTACEFEGVYRVTKTHTEDQPSEGMTCAMPHTKTWYSGADCSTQTSEVTTDCNSPLTVKGNKCAFKISRWRENCCLSVVHSECDTSASSVLDSLYSELGMAAVTCDDYKCHGGDETCTVQTPVGNNYPLDYSQMQFTVTDADVEEDEGETEPIWEHVDLTNILVDTTDDCYLAPDSTCIMTTESGTSLSQQVSESIVVDSNTGIVSVDPDASYSPTVKSTSTGSVTHQVFRSYKANKEIAEVKQVPLGGRIMPVWGSTNPYTKKPEKTNWGYIIRDASHCKTRHDYTIIGKIEKKSDLPGYTGTSFDLERANAFLLRSPHSKNYKDMNVSQVGFHHNPEDYRKGGKYYDEPLSVLKKVHAADNGKTYSEAKDEQPDRMNYEDDGMAVRSRFTYFYPLYMTRPGYFDIRSNWASAGVKNKESSVQPTSEGHDYDASYYVEPDSEEQCTTPDRKKKEIGYWNLLEGNLPPKIEGDYLGPDGYSWRFKHLVFKDNAWFCGWIRRLPIDTAATKYITEWEKYHKNFTFTEETTALNDFINANGDFVDDWESCTYKKDQLVLSGEVVVYVPVKGPHHSAVSNNEPKAGDWYCNGYSPSLDAARQINAHLCTDEVIKLFKKNYDLKNNNYVTEDGGIYWKQAFYSWGDPRGLPVRMGLRVGDIFYTVPKYKTTEDDDGNITGEELEGADKYWYWTGYQWKEGKGLFSDIGNEGYDVAIFYKDEGKLDVGEVSGHEDKTTCVKARTIFSGRVKQLSDIRACGALLYINFNNGNKYHRALFLYGDLVWERQANDNEDFLSDNDYDGQVAMEEKVACIGDTYIAATCNIGTNKQQFHLWALDYYHTDETDTTPRTVYAHYTETFDYENVPDLDLTTASNLSLGVIERYGSAAIKRYITFLSRHKTGNRIDSKGVETGKGTQLLYCFYYDGSGTAIEATEYGSLNLIATYKDGSRMQDTADKGGICGPVYMVIEKPLIFTSSFCLDSVTSTSNDNNDDDDDDDTTTVKTGSTKYNACDVYKDGVLVDTTGGQIIYLHGSSGIPIALRTPIQSLYSGVENGDFTKPTVCVCTDYLFSTGETVTGVVSKTTGTRCGIVSADQVKNYNLRKGTDGSEEVSTLSLHTDYAIILKGDCDIMNNLAFKSDLDNEGDVTFKKSASVENCLYDKVKDYISQTTATWKGCVFDVVKQIIVYTFEVPSVSYCSVCPSYAHDCQEYVEYERNGKPYLASTFKCGCAEDSDCTHCCTSRLRYRPLTNSKTSDLGLHYHMLETYVFRRRSDEAAMWEGSDSYYYGDEVCVMEFNNFGRFTVSSTDSSNELSHFAAFKPLKNSSCGETTVKDFITLGFVLYKCKSYSGSSITGHGTEKYIMTASLLILALWPQADGTVIGATYDWLSCGDPVCKGSMNYGIQALVYRYVFPFDVNGSILFISSADMGLVIRPDGSSYYITDSDKFGCETLPCSACGSYWTQTRSISKDNELSAIFELNYKSTQLIEASCIVDSDCDVSTLYEAYQKHYDKKCCQGDGDGEYALIWVDKKWMDSGEDLKAGCKSTADITDESRWEIKNFYYQNTIVESNLQGSIDDWSLSCCGNGVLLNYKNLACALFIEGALKKCVVVKGASNLPALFNVASRVEVSSSSIIKRASLRCCGIDYYLFQMGEFHYTPSFDSLIDSVQLDVSDSVDIIRSDKKLTYKNSRERIYMLSLLASPEVRYDSDSIKAKLTTEDGHTYDAILVESEFIECLYSLGACDDNKQQSTPHVYKVFERPTKWKVKLPDSCSGTESWVTFDHDVSYELKTKQTCFCESNILDIYEDILEKRVGYVPWQYAKDMKDRHAWVFYKKNQVSDDPRVMDIECFRHVEDTDGDGLYHGITAYSIFYDDPWTTQRDVTTWEEETFSTDDDGKCKSTQKKQITVYEQRYVQNPLMFFDPVFKPQDYIWDGVNQCNCQLISMIKTTMPNVCIKVWEYEKCTSDIDHSHDNPFIPFCTDFCDEDDLSRLQKQVIYINDYNAMARWDRLVVNESTTAKNAIEPPDEWDGYVDDCTGLGGLWVSAPSYNDDMMSEPYDSTGRLIVSGNNMLFVWDKNNGRVVYNGITGEIEDIKEVNYETL